MKKKIKVTTGNHLLLSDFKSEKEMEDYFFVNVKKCFFAITGEEVKEARRQYAFTTIKSDNDKILRAHCRGIVDFLITDKKNQLWLVELKNPKLSMDLVSGITQLLFYRKILSKTENREARLLLVSTVMDSFVGDFIFEDFKDQIYFSVINKHSVYNLNNYGT